MNNRYRVMIVDDEPEIRKGIRMKVDWDELGAVVAAEASNGQEALACLEQEKLDIVITDMHMPLMNGVELLQLCSEHYPDTKLIVLTGYDDFLYAKAAVRNRVHDYLLKPVIQLELKEALTKIIRELDARKREKAQQAQMKWQLSRDRIAMREQFVLLSVKGTFDHARIWQDEAKRVDMASWDCKDVVFATLDPGAHPDRKSFRLPFELLCRELAEDGGAFEAIVFRDPGYPFMLHLAVAAKTEADDAGRADGEKNGFAEIKAWILHNKATIERMLSLSVACGISAPTRGFASWKSSYLSALLHCSENREHGSADGQSQTHEFEMTPETERQLVYLLKSGNREAFHTQLNALLSAAERQSPRQLSRTIFYICQAMESAAHSYALTLKPEQRIWLQPEWVWHEGDAAQAAMRLGHVADDICAQIARKNDMRDDGLFEDVKAFINEHYASDITLTSLAERYHFHPSYFSEMFRIHIGQTFSDYLTEVRMTQAARLLLETDVPMTEIGELCGYANPSYFSTAFKKRFGMSPSRYRLAHKR